MYKLVSIKEGYPDSDYAIYLMEKEIEFAKAEGIKVLVFIHGYGSHGVGGVIKKKVMQSLLHLKKSKKIINFVLGENWSTISEDVKEICKYAPEATRAIAPTIIPLRKPTRISLNTSFSDVFASRSSSLSTRIVTASDCVPTLPAIPSIIDWKKTR